MKIIGHQQIMAYFAQCHKNGTFAHAYLFSGSEGVGKCTVALYLSSLMLCEQHGHTPCGQCVPCSKIESGSHPDVKVITPDGSNIKIEQIRALQKACAYAPSEGPYKIFIFDHADLMNAAAANCLLKTLEEPPPYVRFLLCTSRPQQMLPTIVSRCQRVAFEPVTVAEIQRFLIAQGEEPDRADVLAHLSGGSIGRALWLQTEGLHARDVAAEILDCVLDRDVFKTFLLCEQYENIKQELPLVLQQILVLVRDVLAHQVGADDGMLVNDDWRKRIHAWSLRSSPAVLMKFAQRVRSAERQLDFYVNPRLLLESLVIEYGVQNQYA